MLIVSGFSFVVLHDNRIGRVLANRVICTTSLRKNRENMVANLSGPRTPTGKKDLARCHWFVYTV